VRRAVPNIMQQGSSSEKQLCSLAAKATEAMRLGGFKEAIELLKRLVKQDPEPRWRDMLADAYAGRARSLAAKGMFDEAETALNKTAAADGTVREPLLYVQCLAKRGQLGKALQHAVKYIGTDKVPAASAAQMAELTAALWLVAPVRVDAQADPSSELGQWALSAAAAQQSLAAWVEGKPAQEIDPLLSRIPMRSAFRPLRLILKSLITAPTDPVRARQLLDSIGRQSPFACWRDAAAAALPEETQEPPTNAAPPSRAQCLFAAEVKGLEADESRLLAEFVKAERSGAAALISFLTSRAAALPATEAKSACFNLLARAPDRLRQVESTFGSLAEFDRARILALAAEAANDWERAEAQWCIAAKAAERSAEPESGLIAGVIYRHVAGLAETYKEIAGGGDISPSIDYLERSLRADPDHLPAVLKLIGLYRTEEQDKDWHRSVEDAARRFPQQSAVLLQAVDSAIARKAYKRAVGFARRILALDPINQAVRQRMIELQITHARKQARSKRADLAWKELADAAEWERQDAPSWRLCVNQGLVAWELGNVADAEARLRRGVELAGGGVVGWFCASIEHALMKGGAASEAVLREELVQARNAVAPAKEEILSVALAFSLEEIPEARKDIVPLVFRIRGWLLQGANLAWTAAEIHPVSEMLRLAGAYDLLADYARQALLRTPDDATWKLYRVMARVKGDAERLSVREEDELMDLVEDAEARKDFHTANRIQRFLDSVPDFPTASHGTRRGPSAKGIGSFDDTEERLISQLLEVSLEETPPKMVERLVAKLGRERAISAVLERLRRTPLGQLFPVENVRRVAEEMVDMAGGQTSRSVA
jgi:tetratricopeptide (TPR) repeat protein